MRFKQVWAFLKSFLFKYWVYLVLCFAVATAVISFWPSPWVEKQLTGLSRAVKALNLKQSTLWGASLWEWADLLIVPLLLAIGAFLVRQFLEGQEKRREAKDEELAADRNLQEVLKDYLDQMNQFLLDDSWPREINCGDEAGISRVSNQPIVVVMRARTLAVLRELDGKRNGYVVRFLIEANALPFVPLKRVDLSRADLSKADLSKADLRWANLRGTIFDSSTQLSDKWRLVHEIVNHRVSNQDLKWADLRETNLRGADLRETNLRGADLRETNLRGANLRETNLRGANLSRANLREANLRGANLRGANLREANLRGANLRGAVLRGAVLRGADLKGADLRWANLRGADLADAWNLTSTQVKAAKEWKQARYSPKFRAKLGLPKAK